MNDVVKSLLGLALLGLAACATVPDGMPGSTEKFPVERPSSEKPSLTKERTTAKIHVDLGTSYLEANNLGTALDEARVAIAWDRNYAPGHALLGKVFASLEQYPQAQAAFAEAISLAPGDPEVNQDYGWFLCNQGRNKEGVVRLEQAARNPYNTSPARAWTTLGLCNVQMKNDAAAETAFMRAYQINSDNLRVIYHLAEISLRKGNLVRAREFASELGLKLAGSNTSASLWLSLRIERKLGNRAQEQKLATQLAREFPASDEYQAYLQGRFE